MSIHNPTVLVTRPVEGATRFLAALTSACPRPFASIISPLFAFETLGKPDNAEFDAAVFTSAQAVQVDGNERTAYCVGARTSARAEQVGFKAINADGDAKALTAMIIRDHPKGHLVHFRGEASVGDIAAQLRKAGITCDERVIYRKASMPLSETAHLALNGERALVLPVFSPESADKLAAYAPFKAPLHVCAMSAEVAHQAACLSPKSLQICARPRLKEMVALVAAQIA